MGQAAKKISLSSRTAKAKKLAVVKKGAKASRELTKVNTRWFQDHCRSRGLTQRFVAKALGVDPATLSMIFKGSRKLRLEEAVVIAELFSVGLDEVLVAAGISMGSVKPTAKGLEVGGWVDGEGRLHRGPVKGGRIAPPLPQGEAISGRVGVARYQTIGTLIEALDGALVYYPVTDRLAVDALGRFCVVGLERGEMVVGTLKRGHVAGTFSVLDLGGRVIAEDVAVEWAAAVIWLKM